LQRRSKGMGIEKCELCAQAASQERVWSRSALGGIVVNNVGEAGWRRIAALEAAQAWLREFASRRECM
jgi:hypothetical protein